MNHLLNELPCPERQDGGNIELILLRHAETLSNLSRRYLGQTDEPLCEQGIKRAKRLFLPPVNRVFVSPLIRCRQTAAIVFPQAEQVLAEGLQECDFGEFEGKNYRELSADSRYQAWIDSGGELPFPGGESRGQFCRRTCLSFEELLPELMLEPRTAIVAHGGTLMALLERFGEPARGYFDWQVKPCCGFSVFLQAGEHTPILHVLEELSC